MKRKRGLALFLCMAMAISSLTGCGGTKVKEAKNDVTLEVMDENEVADAASEQEKPAPISDAVNTEDDSAVNYDTNIVSGADVQKNTDEEEKKMVFLVG